jgi:hypothetical protein
VSLKEENVERLKEIAARRNVVMQVIGSVGGSRLTIQPLVQLAVDELHAIWTESLAARLR